MDNVMLVPKQDDLKNYVDFLFSGLEGYVYVVARVPNSKESWDQAFFEYPSQNDQIVSAISKFSKDHEIYIGPAIYKSKIAQKEHIKATNVLWAEFDGNSPESFDVPPSLVIRSSEPGHTHVYWKLDKPLTDVETIEDYNRRICYRFDADPSCWDAVQVLRPPFTVNHKRGGLPVGILQSDNLSFNVSVFDELAPPPAKNVDYSLWEKVDMPDLNDVIYRHKFGPDFKTVFEKSKNDVQDRSAALTNMAYICAEAGLSDKEIYVVLSHLCDRWEKFKFHRPDSRARQIIAIIEHARIKYPDTAISDLDQVFEYSPLTLLQTDIQVEWAVKDLLISNGVMMLAGQSGIGKTQLSMQFMAHMAMGKKFLHYEIERPLKLGFFSLEMGDVEVKSFLQHMYPVWQQRYSQQDLDLLNANLKIIPFGEALALNTPAGQEVFTQYMEANDWDGVFIDSVGSAIAGNISDSSNVQPFTNFNDKIRKRYGTFLWYIHHFRKPPPGTRMNGEQSDVYGDQYLAARSTSMYSLLKAKDGMLRMKNTKQRHAKTEEDYLISRTEGLYFEYMGHDDDNEKSSPIEVIKKQLTTEEGEDQSPSPFI